MAVKKASDNTFASVARELAAGHYAPVYLLCGEEMYYIDRLLKAFDAVVPEPDKEFNEYVLYGAQVEPHTVTDLCMGVPMMAARQLVVLKEAQAMKPSWLNMLVPYVLDPTPSTVLVIAMRGGRSAELAKAVKKGGGVVFESPKIPDYKVQGPVADIIASLGMRGDEKVVSMLCDFIGSDLSRVHNEVAKLAAILGPGAQIKPADIERNIGYTKDFNTFELVEAVAARNETQAWRIAAYFDANPKAAPLPLVVAQLFNFFADVLIAWYTPGDRSADGLMKAMKLSFPAARKVSRALGLYNARQAIEIMDAIRNFDAMSKGIGSRQLPPALFRDLLFRIFSAPGRLPV